MVGWAGRVGGWVCVEKTHDKVAEDNQRQWVGRWVVGCGWVVDGTCEFVIPLAQGS